MADTSRTQSLCSGPCLRKRGRAGRATRAWAPDVAFVPQVLLLSLCGAAVAALGQGMATSYSVFFAMRALSGVWAAVGSSAQVCERRAA